MRLKVHGIVVDNTYDVPYLAGYNKDGTVIYWDRKVPQTFPVGPKGKQVNVLPFVVLHELVEQKIEQVFGLSYQHSHQIALAAEGEAIRQAGLDWDTYDKHFKYWIEKCRTEFSRLPPDLDLQPYKDCKDTKILNRIRIGTMK